MMWGKATTVLGDQNFTTATDAFNVAVGHGALTTDTLGDRAVAIGLNALAAQNFTTSFDDSESLSLL